MEVEEIKAEEFVIEDTYPELAKDDFDIGNKSGVNLETQHRCDICNEIFSNKTNLMVHALIHSNFDNPDKCPHCGKVFTTRGSLTRHIRVHSGERPYKCVYCEKSFTQSCNLDKHVRIHSGERPYKCSLPEGLHSEQSSDESHAYSFLQMHPLFDQLFR